MPIFFEQCIKWCENTHVQRLGDVPLIMLRLGMLQPDAWMHPNLALSGVDLADHVQNNVSA